VPVIPEDNVEKAGWRYGRPVNRGCVDVVTTASGAALFWRCTAKSKEIMI